MKTIPNPSGPIQSGYLLVDASNVDDETFDNDLPMVPCVPALLSQSEHLMPRLIDVAALSPAQQEGLGDVLSRELRGERPPVVCAWLAGPADSDGLDAKVLWRHLTRFLVGRDLAGDAVYWRYFDPRVFSIVMNLFATEQAQALLGPIHEWRFPWCARWWSVSGTGHESDLLLGTRPAWPSEKQWRNIENSALIASVLNRFESSLPIDKKLTDAGCLQLQKTIHHTIQNAREHLLLSDQEDLIEYAFHLTRYGDDFHQHAKLTEAWAELAQRRTTWSDIISTLDESDYRSLNKYSQISATLGASK